MIRNFPKAFEGQRSIHKSAHFGNFRLTKLRTFGKLYFLANKNFDLYFYVIFLWIINNAKGVGRFV